MSLNSELGTHFAQYANNLSTLSLPVCFLELEVPVPAEVFLGLDLDGQGQHHFPPSNLRCWS